MHQFVTVPSVLAPLPFSHHFLSICIDAGGHKFFTQLPAPIAPMVPISLVEGLFWGRLRLGSPSEFTTELGSLSASRCHTFDDHNMVHSIP